MSSAWMQAFAMVFDPYTIVVMLGASVFGLFVGAVPGLTATMATALLVPVTFFLPPIPAIATMVTATAVAIFAGDIPGCLLRILGTPALAEFAIKFSSVEYFWLVLLGLTCAAGIGSADPLKGMIALMIGLII